MSMSQFKRHIQGGFTLIEVMIVVAIIGILATIAIPSYNDYVLRSRLVDATNALSVMRADMERHFQDNRTYATVGAFVSPCLSDVARRTTGNFVVGCVEAPNATTFTLEAVGNGPAAGFAFTLNQANVQGTTAAPADWIAGGVGACATTWVLKRGQPCT